MWGFTETERKKMRKEVRERNKWKAGENDRRAERYRETAAGREAFMGAIRPELGVLYREGSKSSIMRMELEYQDKNNNAIRIRMDIPYKDFTSKPLLIWIDTPTAFFVNDEGTNFGTVYEDYKLIADAILKGKAKFTNYYKDTPGRYW